MSVPTTHCSADPRDPALHQTLTINGEALSLLPATIEDTPEFVDLFYRIFKNDLIFRAMYGTASWPLIVARTVRQWEEELSEELGEGRLRWFKVVDEDGTIIAISKWALPHTPTPTDHEISPSLSDSDFIPGENKIIGDTWFTGLTSNRSKFYSPETMYYMNTLAVAPECQRMGLGMAMMRSVLDIADAEGRGAYVEAASSGLGLYERCGFKEVGKVGVDCSGFVDGEETIFVSVCMVREAGGGI